MFFRYYGSSSNINYYTQPQTYVQSAASTTPTIYAYPPQTTTTPTNYAYPPQTPTKGYNINPFGFGRQNSVNY